MVGRNNGLFEGTLSAFCRKKLKISTKNFHQHIWYSIQIIKLIWGG